MAGNNCPRVCCWGTPPQAFEQDEFYDLPREKRKPKKKSSRSKRSLQPNLETVKEESTTGTASTISFASSSASDNDNARECRSVDGGGKERKKKHKENFLPEKKLSFVNGQFVDLSTKEGKDLVDAVASTPDGYVIGGIVTSFKPGHGNNFISEHHDLSHIIPAKITHTKLKNKFKHFGSSLSNASEDDGTRSSTKSRSEPQSYEPAKESVTSLVVLGNGYFLTGSKSDRTIRMWKASSENEGKVVFNFVRDFVGHNTGVTALARVDKKGRFLSASKDKSVKLFDSRCNCDDVKDTKERVLLASFTKMNQRQINTIAVIESGSYVRPTDEVDFDMASSCVKKALKEGSGAVQRAATEKHVVQCSAEFAACSGKHRTVKVWSVSAVKCQDGFGVDDNVAELTLVQELNHDAVVESVVASPQEGLLLCGDRMGHVVLWEKRKNVFLPKSQSNVWSQTRTFSWRSQSDLRSIDECKLYGITSLSFLGGSQFFVSGNRAGNLRVWRTDGSNTSGEIVRKEVITVTGAHSDSVTAVIQGPCVNADNIITFSSSSKDGKVLSFAFPEKKAGKSNPLCFDAVNHGVANRYTTDHDDIEVTSLVSMNMSKGDILLSSSTNHYVNLIGPSQVLSRGQDALILYRRQIEQESLTLHHIAEELSRGIESRDRKYHMKTHKNCFTGSDAVTFLVDKKHAVTRNDAVDLGRVLGTHLHLHESVLKNGTHLEDTPKSLFRFSEKFLANSKESERRRKSTTF